MKTNFSLKWMIVSRSARSLYDPVEAAFTTCVCKIEDYWGVFHRIHCRCKVFVAPRLEYYPGRRKVAQHGIKLSRLDDTQPLEMAISQLPVTEREALNLSLVWGSQDQRSFNVQDRNQILLPDMPLLD